jgi:uncharacterized protein (DUF58 family)
LSQLLIALMAFSKFIRSLYFSSTFWVIWCLWAIAFVFAYVFPALLPVCHVGLMVYLIIICADIFPLYRKSNGVFSHRSSPDRLSNGDDNPITIYLENHYPFTVSLEIIDELPHQFQRRDSIFKTRLKKNEKQQISYELRPVNRGEFEFGQSNVYVLTPLGLTKRRYQFDQGKRVAVYPSFIQMRHYALMATANRLNQLGVRRIRRIGHSTEFDQVRPYVTGDDRRTLNWKATARKGEVMVNAFQDERAQSVYCLIDKGRTMQSPSNGLTLLDYAINSSLVITNIALTKQDKAGLLTFSNINGQIVPANRQPGHLQKIMEVLYHQSTHFLESDFERLSHVVRYQIKQRSLLLLFTNFETVDALKRQLPYLRQLAKNHLLVVVLFENTETKHLIETPATTTESIYLKTLAQKFHLEKKRIVLELERYGIQSVLTAPQQLSVNTINKYLELKARGSI